MRIQIIGKETTTGNKKPLKIFIIYFGTGSLFVLFASLSNVEFVFFQTGNPQLMQNW